MKKFAAISLSALMMITNVFADANVSVTLNDEVVSFANQKPVIIEGRTLIPLRSIFENIGYTIEWQPETKTAVLKNDNGVVTITANADEFDVNGNLIKLDTPAQILNGSMMLPLRAIGEASGLSVGWDNETKVVSLKQKDIKAVNVEDSEAKKEMDEFYHNAKALTDIKFCYEFISNLATGELLSIKDEINKGTLAYTKAAEKTKELMVYIDAIKNKVDSWKVPDDYKTAKSNLIECINDYKKLAEVINNDFNNVYPNEDSYNKDFDDTIKNMGINSATIEMEMDRLNNQYNRVMYKYFDTDKDTDENKKLIEAFVADIGAVAEKYPIPSHDDIFDDDGINIDNIDKNIDVINKAIEGRKAEFENINVPDNCHERMELIKYSNEVLINLSDALKEYKVFGDKHYNPNVVDVFMSSQFYDSISVLASDNELKRFFEDEDSEYTFENHQDKNYTSITVDNISSETQEFVNNFFYAGAISEYMIANDNCNEIYGAYFDYNGNIINTGKNVNEFFDIWKTEQRNLLSKFKEFKVTETLMAMKSAAINYMEQNIERIKIMQSYYSKQIADDKYNTLNNELEEKLDAVENTYMDEKQRIESKLDDYMYDYFDTDMARTENSEIIDFGKKIIEINDKYPIYGDGYGEINLSNKITLDENDIKALKTNCSKALKNIEKREAEYKDIKVPTSCEKRMELIYAADKILSDFYNNEEFKANDEAYLDNMMININIYEDCFDNLMIIATGGAEYNMEEEE